MHIYESDDHGPIKNMKSRWRWNIIFDKIFVKKLEISKIPHDDSQKMIKSKIKKFFDKNFKKISKIIVKNYEKSKSILKMRKNEKNIQKS